MTDLADAVTDRKTEDSLERSSLHPNDRDVRTLRARQRSLHPDERRPNDDDVLLDLCVFAQRRIDSSCVVDRAKDKDVVERVPIDGDPVRHGPGSDDELIVRFRLAVREEDGVLVEIDRLDLLRTRAVSSRSAREQRAPHGGELKIDAELVVERQIPQRDLGRVRDERLGELGAVDREVGFGREDLDRPCVPRLAKTFDGVSGTGSSANDEDAWGGGRGEGRVGNGDARGADGQRVGGDEDAVRVDVHLRVSESTLALVEGERADLEALESVHSRCVCGKAEDELRPREKVLGPTYLRYPPCRHQSRRRAKGCRAEISSPSQPSPLSIAASSPDDPPAFREYALDERGSVVSALVAGGLQTLPSAPLSSPPPLESTHVVLAPNLTAEIEISNAFQLQAREEDYAPWRGGSWKLNLALGTGLPSCGRCQLLLLTKSRPL